MLFMDVEVEMGMREVWLMQARMKTRVFRLTPQMPVSGQGIGRPCFEWLKSMREPQYESVADPQIVR